MTITGANFGTAPGTLKFNGVSASPTNWSTGSLTAPVPASATTGPVEVTTSAGTSNTLTFTVWTTGAIAGTVTRLTGGQPLAGALLEILQSGIVKATRTTPADGTYSVTSLTSGTYDVRCSLSGFVTVMRTNVSVGGGATTAIDLALAQPGSISGTVTQSGGSTPIAGAAVSIAQDDAVVSSTTTDATGAYVVIGVAPGTYSVQASAIGYAPESQSGIVVTENSNASANFALSSAPPSSIRFVYDELGRLVAAVNLVGETARYSYDAVGNLTSITRQSSSTLSLLAFSPHTGPIGTTVTIVGTGFSSTPSLNSVTFGGIPASVTSSTPTSLVVAVPSGLSAGPAAIVVTVGGSSVGSANDFEVTSGDFEFVPAAPIASAAASAQVSNSVSSSGNATESRAR